MSRDTLNPEGLTFEEWVCAAGVAKTNVHYGWDNDPFPWVRPYCESHEVGVPEGSGRYQLYNGVIMERFKLVRRTTVYYSKKIREAWRRGEDPTEWRHA